MHHAHRTLGTISLPTGRLRAAGLESLHVPALRFQTNLMGPPARVQSRTGEVFKAKCIQSPKTENHAFLLKKLYFPCASLVASCQGMRTQSLKLSTAGPEVSLAVPIRIRVMPRLLAKLSQPTHQRLRQPTTTVSAASLSCWSSAAWKSAHLTPLAAQTRLTGGARAAASSQQHQLLTLLLQPRHKLSSRCHAPVSSSAVDRTSAGKAAPSVEGETASTGRKGEQQEQAEADVSTENQPGQDRSRIDVGQASRDAGKLASGCLLQGPVHFTSRQYTGGNRDNTPSLCKRLAAAA